MRRVLAVLLVGLLLPAVRAEDEASEPAPPLSVDEAAGAVLAVIEAGDAKGLKTLAETDDPDPWLVADELCFRGDHDAAEAFAKAAPRVDVEKLPAYVASRRDLPSDALEQESLQAMNAALAARRPDEALRTAAALPEDLDSVIRVRLAHGRGITLRQLRRLDESATHLHRAARAAESMGWLGRADVVYHEVYESAWQGSTWARALEAAEARLALAGRRGDGVQQARVLGGIANAHLMLGNHAKALATYGRGIERAQAVGDRAALGSSLLGMGNLQSQLGRHAEALATLERALEQLEALGNRAWVGRTLVSIGTAQRALSEPRKALATYERALGHAEAAGDGYAVGRCLLGIGDVQSSVGQYARSLATYGRALQHFEALGDREGLASARGAIGVVHWELGQFAKALSMLELALESQRAMGDRVAAASTLSNVGMVQSSLGDDAKALATFERALEMMHALGDRAGVARTLGNIGVIQHDLGEYAKALATHERALDLKEALGDRSGVAVTLGNIGVARHSLGELEDALATYERALALQEASGQRTGVVTTLVNIGVVHLDLGNLREGRRALERSVREAKALRAASLVVRGLTRLADMHLEAGKHYRALASSQRALEASQDLLGGLGEEEGASARDRFSTLYAIGALAAARAEETADLLSFLEHGRAGALLDTLDKREALRWKAETLPEGLRRVDEEARDAERLARRAYGRALSEGDVREIRKTAGVLDDAIEEVRAAAARIQRDLKAQAGLFYPRAETLESIEMALAKDEALVLYGLCLDEALALVLRQDGERIVPLGQREDVEALCMAAAPMLSRSGDRGPLADVPGVEPTTDTPAILAKLRAALVDPLELGEDVKTVLVSPEGPLCYLPFGALFEQTVAMTPSGTTHVLLLDEERGEGEGVLALGDPDYAGTGERSREIYFRGRRLLALPATRPEAEAVGTKTLVGADANEAGLRKVLPEAKRWRAIHFACHGLIDVERPMLSSLALTSSGEDDGFLTALEVLRMEIPTDLVALSACETGKGKVVKGEGIVGLTRAFMYAGAPRVLCSLWKVDDEATRALMVKFYELWNPRAEPSGPERAKQVEGSEAKRKGPGAAEALKQAQAFVRDHPDHSEWKDPHYWAAWVLWGLPE